MIEMAHQYRREITITNTGEARSNYVELISLDPDELTGKVDVNLYCLRFKDSLGNPLYHWIMPETRAEDPTRIFVRIPTVAGNDDTYIYMYYGDTNLPNIESGANTFTFFDDFENGTIGNQIDTELWPNQNGIWTYQEIDGERVARVAATDVYDGMYNHNYTLNRNNDGIRILSRMRGTSNGGRKRNLDIYDFSYSYSMAYVTKGVDEDRKVELGGSDPNWSDWVDFESRWQDDTFYTVMITIEPVGEGATITMYYDYDNNPSGEIHYNRSTITGDCCMRLSTYQSPQEAHYAYWSYAAFMPYSSLISNVVGAEENLGPIINSISPNSASPGQTKTNITITGHNFESGATVKLEKTGESDINATNVVVEDSENIICDLTIPGDTEYGWWGLRVTNP